MLSRDITPYERVRTARVIRQTEVRRRPVIAFDLETMPDLSAVARVHGLDPSDEAGCRAALGSRFPKLPFHQIVCVGALVATWDTGTWRVQSLDAQHAGETSEAVMIATFASRVEALRPQLVSFNGSRFDLPVLRYRALVNRVPIPGLDTGAYFHRYAERSLDLCDYLANYDRSATISLDALCRTLDLPGKPAGIDGSCVEAFMHAGRAPEVAAYCCADVAATYRVFLALERVRGRLSARAYDESGADLERVEAGLSALSKPA
jgi:predicted PolB exonuclease-like 3'-5' exonuclease